MTATLPTRAVHTPCSIPDFNPVLDKPVIVEDPIMAKDMAEGPMLAKELTYVFV
jgi:hypothetical protein